MINPRAGRSLGYQQMTSLASATAPTVPAGASWAVLVAEAQIVRWRDDGTDPTASIGMTLAAGVPYEFTGDFDRLKFIEATASAKLNITYYGAV